MAAAQKSAAGQPHGERFSVSEQVSLNDVRRVAELANLDLTAEESARMLHDLSAILEHVAELSALDTTGVAPLSQVSELEGIVGALRADRHVPSLDRSTVMAEAPETDQSFFKVPKVIER